MDYDEFRATAVDLIADFGNARTFTFRRNLPGTYDPLADTITGGGPATPVVMQGVFSKLSDSETRTLPDDLTIQDTAKIVVPAAEDFEPMPGDRVTCDHTGETYVIRIPVRARPDGDHIYHSLICGKTEQ